MIGSAADVTILNEWQFVNGPLDKACQTLAVMVAALSGINSREENDSTGDATRGVA